MAKRSGIRDKLKIVNMKPAKPVSTKRVSVPAMEYAAQTAPVMMPAAEDTGILAGTLTDASGLFSDADFGSRAAAKRSKRALDSLNANHRHRGARTSISAKFRIFIDTILGRRTRESAALDFAMSGKRVTKKQRRRRMLFAYIGTGAAIAAVLLTVVFVPPGKAASSNADVSAGQSLQMAAAQNADDIKPLPPEQPSPSLSPEGAAAALTQNPAESTETPDPSESQTAEPTEEPTAESTEEPTAEPTEEPTPIPTTKPEATAPPISLDECVDFFIEKADKYYNDMGYSSNHIDYTEDDVYLLAQIITSEARGESREGMIAVGNVVMNRVLNRHQFGNTIKDVVSAPGQFAYNPSVVPTRAAKTAARMVLQDEVWVVAQDVYYFRSGAAAGVDWGSHPFYKKIGNHCFYSHSYSGRHRGGDPPPKLFDRTYKYAQYGCKPGKRVYRIQWMLNKLGYDVKADSYFGKDTVDALKAFQEKYGLEADGIAGTNTVSKLIKVYGLANYYNKFLAK